MDHRVKLIEKSMESLSRGQKEIINQIEVFGRLSTCIYQLVSRSTNESV